MRGEAVVARRLMQALCVPPLGERPSDLRQHQANLTVHLFHSYAARTHPFTLRHLLSDVKPGQHVLDPFVGSGTTLVEALLRGARGTGRDISELSIRLARFKATPMPPAMGVALLARARDVARASEDRIRRKQRPALSFDDRRFYEPHVYLEMCGLREEIERVRAEDPPLFEGLLLIFSALVVKLSRQRAETDPRLVPRALPPRRATRWFLSKAEEAVRLHHLYYESLPPEYRRAPLLIQGDARTPFPEALAGDVDVVFTSPPYLGVYDYAAHQLRRCAWLGIDPREAAAREMGSRSGALAPGDLRARHLHDTRLWLASVRRVLREGGRLYVLVGDSRVAGKVLPGDAPILEAAREAGLRLRASASALRMNGRPPLREHLLQLEG